MIDYGNMLKTIGNKKKCTYILLVQIKLIDHCILKILFKYALIFMFELILLSSD